MRIRNRQESNDEKGSFMLRTLDFILMEMRKH